MSFTFKIPMSITIRVSCLQLELGLVFFISIIMHYGGDYFTLKKIYFEIVLMVYSCLQPTLGANYEQFLVPLACCQLQASLDAYS